MVLICLLLRSRRIRFAKQLQGRENVNQFLDARKIVKQPVLQVSQRAENRTNARLSATCTCAKVAESGNEDVDAVNGVCDRGAELVNLCGDAAGATERIAEKFNGFQQRVADGLLGLICSDLDARHLARVSVGCCCCLAADGRVELSDRALKVLGRDGVGVQRQFQALQGREVAHGRGAECFGCRLQIGVPGGRDVERGLKQLLRLLDIFGRSDEALIGRAQLIVSDAELHRHGLDESLGLRVLRSQADVVHRLSQSDE